jgi:hypothetical protein
VVRLKKRQSPGFMHLTVEVRTLITPGESFPLVNLEVVKKGAFPFGEDGTAEFNA